MSTHTPTPANPAPPADDRATLAALVQYQHRTPTAGLPVLDAATLHAQIATFPAAVLHPGPALPWGDTQQASWERLSALLVANLATQPPVALQPGLTLCGQPCAGPLFHDVAALLRDAMRDEADELDLAVRWWQQARSVGLPVDADFGECWRAIEWSALHRHLARLSTLYGAGSAGDPAAQRLFDQVGKVALRYGPLKPLLRLLEPVAGARVGAGFTF